MSIRRITIVLMSSAFILNTSFAQTTGSEAQNARGVSFPDREILRLLLDAQQTNGAWGLTSSNRVLLTSVSVMSLLSVVENVNDYGWWNERQAALHKALDYLVNTSTDETETGTAAYIGKLIALLQARREVRRKDVDAETQEMSKSHKGPRDVEAQLYTLMFAFQKECLTTNNIEWIPDVSKARDDFRFLDSILPVNRYISVRLHLRCVVEWAARGGRRCAVNYLNEVWPGLPVKGRQSVVDNDEAVQEMAFYLLTRNTFEVKVHGPYRFLVMLPSDQVQPQIEIKGQQTNMTLSVFEKIRK